MIGLLLCVVLCSVVSTFAVLRNLLTPPLSGNNIGLGFLLGIVSGLILAFLAYVPFLLLKKDLIGWVYCLISGMLLVLYVFKLYYFLDYVIAV